MEAMKLRHMTLNATDWQVFAVGFLTSAIVGYLTVSFLLRFLVGHRLDIFAWYRLLVAAALFLAL